MPVLPTTPWTMEDSADAPRGTASRPGAGPRSRRRPWSHKIRDALRGIKLGIRGHSSFSVHFFFAALVIAAAIVLRCELEQWCALVFCIGLVLTAELFNSAVETLVRGFDVEARNRAKPCLDIAAGAVLLASITAAIIGTAIFLRQLDIL